MKFTENAIMALRNLSGNKIRSLLTMLGVIIGVAAVIVMVALGEGAQRKVTENITAMGSNLVMVFPGRGNSRGGGFGGGEPLISSVLPVIKDASSHIKAIAPEVRRNFVVSFGDNSMQSSVIGCNLDYITLRNYQIAEGRFFDETDLNARSRVAVIGSYVAGELFHGIDPVGQYIKLGVFRYEIIGVLKEKGQSGFGNSDDLLLIPITTMQQRIMGNQQLSTVYIQADSAETVDKVYNQVYDALLEVFQDETKFNIRNQAEILETVQETSKTFTLLLGGIAAVSLLVGGIGIMNIMLVSVTERIKEIGLRKAIGATKWEILSMFLIEAVGLSVTGGLIGICLGWGVGAVVSRVTEWTTVISPESILLSFGFSIMVGLFFGGYPAYKAADLHPIEALRHE
ncbi:MAG TPA: ABC transporter permease [Bacillota bacterium]|nr:ABC transporter permease [Bacillota bacterium]HOL09665.1 ABC transporter permease [Bacillota bacterium]HPO97517.1 ABC transporter permease [Bacillota bacterium]